MKQIDKIIVPYSFYNKVYLEYNDTAIFTLKINNNLVNFEIIITIMDYCTEHVDNYATIEILSNNITQYRFVMETNGYKEVIKIAQDFLISNELLLYIKGFGIPSFNNKVNDTQSKPRLNYEIF